MAELQRFTTEYVEIEDRIRLAGEVAPCHTVVLWLTQRLLARLLPHLLKWLEQQTGATLRGDVLQGFAQQAAMAALEPQDPVPVPHELAWLVHSVDIAAASDGVGLTFKPAGDANKLTRLTLQAQPLRQWLNILYGQYQKAEWPLTVWPAWLAEACSGEASKPMTMLH